MKLLQKIKKVKLTRKKIKRLETKCEYEYERGYGDGFRAADKNDPFKFKILPLNDKQKLLLEQGSRREYRILATDEVFEKLDALIKENEDKCYGGWIPHERNFRDFL